MKGYSAGEGTGSDAAFKKASAFKEVPGGGPSVQDRYEQRMKERAEAGEETKTRRLFGRTWTKTKKFDPETGRKIGKTTVVTDKEGQEIGRSEKGQPTSASTSSTTTPTSTTAPGSYVKKGGKATGNIGDYAIGSEERKKEYDARGWKYDETIKGYNRDGSKIEPTETETETSTDTETDTSTTTDNTYKNLNAAQKEELKKMGVSPEDYDAMVKTSPQASAFPSSPLKNYKKGYYGSKKKKKLK